MKLNHYILNAFLILFSININGQVETINRNKTITETDENVYYSITRLDTLLVFNIKEASNSTATLSSSSTLGWSRNDITSFGSCDTNGEVEYTFTFTGEETADQMFPARISGNFNYCGGEGGSPNSSLDFAYTLNGDFHVYHLIDPPENVIGIGESVNLTATHMDYSEDLINVDWSVNDTTGVSVSTSNGSSVDVTGLSVGSYTVGGSLEIDGSTNTEFAEVDVVTFELEASDDNTHGQNNTRIATEGETLYLVVEDAVSYESATIKASMDDSYSFRSSEPSWTGDGFGITGSTTAFLSDNEGGYVITANAWGSDKSIDIEIVGENKHSFTVFPGANFLNEALNKINDKLSFDAGNVTMGVEINNPTITGSRYTVEAPNSPDTTFSKEGEIGVSGKVFGTIIHPTFSGQFPPRFLPLDPVALWEVSATADITLSLNASVKFEEEYSPRNVSFQGSGGIGGNVSVGIYALCYFAGYSAEGNATASAGIQYTVTTEGENPNKTLEGKLKIQPVTVSAELKLVRTSDGYIRARKSLSYNIWDGYEQDDSTKLIEQPAG
jgi:hypothetical protein